MKRSLLEHDCWICGCTELILMKPSNIDGELTAEGFQVTDADYGLTADIYECQDCGFLQCSNFTDVTDFYENMEDVEYEQTRSQRLVQANTLIGDVAKIRSGGHLLDIGAGSGILVESALSRGYKAEGVEPSRWMHAQAQMHGLPVSLGYFPAAASHDKYDVITLIDVLEHVADPVQLLSQIHTALSDDGIALVVTPDVRSFFARLLGWRWWHFRLAHIGYFSRSTLERACEKADLEIIQSSRPTWYFPLSYLLERAQRYLPRFLRFRTPKFTSKVSVPLNLFDSWQIIVTRK